MSYIMSSAQQSCAGTQTSDDDTDSDIPDVNNHDFEEDNTLDPLMSIGENLCREGIHETNYTFLDLVQKMLREQNLPPLSPDTYVTRKEHNRRMEEALAAEPPNRKDVVKEEWDAKWEVMLGDLARYNIQLRDAGNAAMDLICPANELNQRAQMTLLLDQNIAAFYNAFVN